MRRKSKINYRIITIVIVILIIILGFLKWYMNSYNYNIEAIYPDLVYGVKVNTQIVENNTAARPGEKRKIKYIVIHETDNTSDGATAKNHATYLSENNKTSTSWHYTVDDTEIYHHIPDDEVAHHAATENGNLYGIGIELCVNEDGDFDKTFENGAKLVAYLLEEYNLRIKDIKTHNDFSGKDCPHNILKDNRMEEFKSRVKYYSEQKQH